MTCKHVIECPDRDSICAERGSCYCRFPFSSPYYVDESVCAKFEEEVE